MTDYNFESLNDKEFEALSTDLLSSLWGTKIERFKAGKDEGVDGRFFTSEGFEVIVQCKHWIKSGTQALIRHAKNVEAGKVAKLKPKRYVFVTSLHLSRKDKRNITNIFAPYILSETDIFGNEDINDLLRQNEEIERKHYKLWMSSVNIISKVLHAAIHEQAAAKFQEIRDQLNRYVVTKSHNEAIKKLEDKHSIIITGEPGIGKTTLAEQLCFHYAANGYAFYSIEKSLKEADSVYSAETKQIYYFDDFLGRNFLSAIDSDQDSRVIGFLKKVSKDKSKRFILTTRTNILNRAKTLSDRFEIANSKRNEYQLAVGALTSWDRARMLYNNIWFGGLEEGHIEEIYKRNRYLNIVQHKNFNPRLISFVTDPIRLAEIEPEDYWNFLSSSLQNPAGIWKHVFNTQLSPIQKAIVIAVALCDGDVSEDLLMRFFWSSIEFMNLQNSSEDFHSLMGELSGALLNRNLQRGKTAKYNLFNPSIGDFVYSSCLFDHEYTCRLIYSLNSERVPDALSRYYRSKKSKHDWLTPILECLINKFAGEDTGDSISNFHLSVYLALPSIERISNKPKKHIKKVYRHALTTESNCDERKLNRFLGTFSDIACKKRHTTDLDKYIVRAMREYDRDLDVLQSIGDLVAFRRIENQAIEQEYFAICVNEIATEITKDAVQDGVCSDAMSEDEFDHNEFESYILGRLIDFTDHYESIDIGPITDSFEMDYLIDRNNERYMESSGGMSSYAAEPDGPSAGEDRIVDLFDRS